MGIFDKRRNYRPFEYPIAEELQEKITGAFWTHHELTFEGDKTDFFRLEDYEKGIVMKSLALISTVEVKVKNFWGKIGEFIPKQEFEELGAVAAESEVRHARTYDKLLRVLGREGFYNEIMKNDLVRGRFDYLQKYLGYTTKDGTDKFLLKLILYSVLIENVSLFSQFATIMYLYRHRGIMKDIRNAIKYTSVEEGLHAQIGYVIIDILRREQPQLFTKSLQEKVHKTCLKSIKYEAKLIDWVFEKGEFEKMSKENLKDYMKNRVSESLDRMGFEKLDLEIGSLKETDFFYEEVFADSMDDFFCNRPTDYTILDQSITGETIF